MDNDEERITYLLANKDATVDVEWALKVLDEHPSFTVLAAMLLKHPSEPLTNDTAARLKAIVALGSADKEAMADFADIADSGWTDFYPAPPIPDKKSTEDTIDGFMEAYGHTSPHEEALLEKLIFNPVAPDYFQGLDQPLDPDDPLALPVELLRRAPEEAAEVVSEPAPEAKPVVKEEEKAAKTESAGQKDGPLMESLAKIFIKQRRYERALEIISDLSLKYPEKSAYFADQIRYLRKLILNDQRKAQKKQ